MASGAKIGSSLARLLWLVKPDSGSWVPTGMELNDRYREAVILRDVQGHSYDEIATITGTAISTVKFRIFKARDMLRNRLAAYLVEQ